jgi:phospholipid transport system transporter-binding protein
MGASASMHRPASVLTLGNAESALRAGLQAIDDGQSEFDLAELTSIDSAAVAVLVAWQRAAHARGNRLRFINVPSNVRSLAQLYGVMELLDSEKPVLSQDAAARAGFVGH